MKDIQALLKNRKVVITAGIVILALVLGLVLFILPKSASQTQNGLGVEPTQVPVLTLSASDIGLSFIPDQNLQRGTMEITKTSDIASVDYQLTYSALVAGEQTSRGTIGHVDVKTPGKTITQEMVFGTCSDVCHYDTGISDVKLVVKVTKADGKIYQVELPVSVSQ